MRKSGLTEGNPKNLIDDVVTKETFRFRTNDIANFRNFNRKTNINISFI